MVHRDHVSRLLVVDDNDDNLELIRARLASRGYRVDVAGDGETALAMVREAPPELILLDIMMPGIDGLEVLRRIKSDPALPFIPVIMLTALDSTELKVEGLDAGADDYLGKPVNFAELEARVKALLRIKALQEALASRERDLKQANEQLKELAHTDVLTELDNRRHLDERLGELFEHCIRLNEPFSVVMCDLDRFKSVNDTYGHSAGDQVLRSFAQLLRGAARETDRVGRYGGEEFLFLLPGTVLDAAVTFAERARQAVERHTFTIEGTTLRRTMSCGVAAWPHPRVKTCDDVVHAADAALYVAKETGRNRVVRFDSPAFNAHTQAADGRNRDADVTGRVIQRPGAGDRATENEDLGARAGT
jgi:two-component system cell cycle response regulator